MAKDFVQGSLTPEETAALQREAMQAWESGDRLSKNLSMHRTRYVQRKTAERLQQTQNKRNGGMVKGFSPIARPQRFKGIF
jgi:hypothetical protein|tara:strand:- start:252 stop:494 length:243 start_codon:yes stop_codon:yes gene_type:complete